MKEDKLSSYKEVSRIAVYVRPYWWQLSVATLGLIFGGLIGLVSPQVIRLMLDAAFQARDTTKLNYYVVLLFCLYALQAGLSFARAFLFAQVGERVVTDIRCQLYKHLLCQPVQFFAEKRVGELTSRLSSDVSIIQTVATTSIVELLRQGMVFVGGIVVISIANPRLTVVMLSVLPVMVISAVIFGRYLRRLSTKVQDALAEANGVLDETLSGIRIVQSFVRESYEISRYKQSIEGALKIAIKRAFMTGGFIAFIIFIVFSGIAVVLWYGGHMVIEGKMTAGEMMAFIIYTIIIAFSIAGIAEIYSQLQQARGATRRIFEILDLMPTIADSSSAKPFRVVKGNVEFRNVTFTYPNREHTSILNNISLKANAGEVVAIVGTSGAGKTTLVNLIPRFYDVCSGAILVDEQDIRSLKLADLRSAIAIVPQETTLFSGTVRDNIAYGKLQASDEEIEKAARAANAHSFITELPQGYRSLVGERGVKLSGGQRQRIAIARALLKDPAILILDEATSSLDSESERLVQEALDLLMQGRTAFVIAHRLSTVHKADKIFVIDSGNIVAQGTHSELIEQGGLYKQLCELQFQALATVR